MIEVLRPYQVEVIAKFWRAVKVGQRRIIIVAPTASGKTVIARAIIEQARCNASCSLFLEPAPGMEPVPCEPSVEVRRWVRMIAYARRRKSA